MYSEKLEAILMEFAEKWAKEAATAAEAEALAAVAMAIIENRKLTWPYGNAKLTVDGNEIAEITGASLPSEDEVAAHLASIRPATPDYQAWQRLSEQILGRHSESHQ